MADVSIIVPVYNVERYLDNCIESLVNQAYKDIQIILVDDGSKDHSPEICDSWQRKDARIRVVHKPNGGLSDARNAGLTYVNSEYVAFVDSDDWIDKEYINRLYSTALKHNCDMVICQYYLVYANGGKRKMGRLEDESLSVNSCIEELLIDKNITSHVWRRLYRSKLFENLRFPVGKNYEDILIMTKLTSMCKNIYCISDALYNYRVNNFSIVGNLNFKNLNDYYDAITSRYDYILCNHSDLKEINIKNYNLKIAKLIKSVRLRYSDCDKKDVLKKYKKILRVDRSSFSDFYKTFTSKYIDIIYVPIEKIKSFVKRLMYRK